MRILTLLFTFVAVIQSAGNIPCGSCMATYSFWASLRSLKVPIPTPALLPGMRTHIACASVRPRQSAVPTLTLPLKHLSVDSESSRISLLCSFHLQHRQSSSCLLVTWSNSISRMPQALDFTRRDDHMDVALIYSLPIPSKSVPNLISRRPPLLTTSYPSQVLASIILGRPNSPN